MSERVVWVVEFSESKAKNDWHPTSGVPFFFKAPAQREAARLDAASQELFYRAWPYVAKESAQ